MTSMQAQLSLKKLTLSFLILFLTAFNTVVSQTKYPSLLWEITGNGLTKPSYLYGTMHVSSKLAYHLSDSFFVALANVNTVGLESNPDQWLKHMKDMGMLEQFNNPNNNNNNFYKDAFKIDIPTNKQYADVLANDPDIINNLLYRNNSYKADHEESTYIDLFIYKTGSKLNKKIVSLEDFKTSLVMASKSYVPDPNEKTDDSRKNIDYYKIQDEINNAYRSGNLDQLDSLTKLTYFSKNTQKYLIDDRNVILAHNIDSICKTGSLFSGIGAAHLPGKSGVIELLRSMGYILRPIANIHTKKGDKQKDNIEKIVKKLPFSKHYSTDSLFSYELFDEPVKLANVKGFSFGLATDMANGSYYTITRQITYAPLFNYSIDNMLSKIDSLLYENIPGKIVSKKYSINTPDMKCIDITNKTKRGDLQHYHIYLLENEFIVFKMSGKGNYINETEANRFFNSIKFYPKPQTSLVNYSPLTKGFEIKIPSNYKYIYNKKTGLQGTSETLFAHDNSKKSVYGVIHYYYHDFNYLEEDTFELNILCNNALKNFDYTVNISRELGKDQNLPSITFKGENAKSNKTFNGKIIIKGVHYYLVYQINKTDDNSDKTVLNSFKLTDFYHKNEIKTITDHDYAFTVEDELTPEDKNQLEEALAGFYAEIQKEKDKKTHSKDFDYLSKSKHYYSPSSGEHVNIDYEKFNDYDYRDPKTFWDDVKKIVKSERGFIVTNTKLQKQNGIESYDVTLKDTACSNIIKRKYILKDGLVFCLSAVTDTVFGTTGWTEGFFKSFKPKDTTISKSIYTIKTPLLLKDLNSADSSVRYAAKQSLISNSIDKSSAKEIIAFINGPDFHKLDEESRAVFLVNGGVLNNESIISVYKKLYDLYEDSSYMQICIIKGLGYLKTKNSYNTIYELLKTKTPLTGDESIINDILTPLYDSLELCNNFFPGLFSLESFEEYKTPMLKLFSDLVIRKIITPVKYTPNVASLTTNANNELKRYNTSSNKNSKNTSNYDELATLKANELSDFYGGLYTDTILSNGKKAYVSYNNMIENYAYVLAPFYASNPATKQFYDKLFKIKQENTLLNICLIALQNNIPVNDTMWKYFSNNSKTKLKLYNELNTLKHSEKFDKSKLSQEDFCKTLIESDIEFNDNDYENNDESLKEKVKPDSISFLRKEYVKNKKEKGNIYFFERTDSKSKSKSLAYAFVPEKPAITTDIEIMNTKHVIEIGKTTEDVINSVKTEFYYRGRLRYVSENETSGMNYLDNYGGE